MAIEDPRVSVRWLFLSTLLGVILGLVLAPLLYTQPQGQGHSDSISSTATASWLLLPLGAFFPSHRHGRRGEAEAGSRRDDKGDQDVHTSAQPATLQPQPVTSQHETVTDRLGQHEQHHDTHTKVVTSLSDQGTFPVVSRADPGTVPGAMIRNKRLLLDKVMLNPGDDLGFERTKYADPEVMRDLGYSGMVASGDLSFLLAADFSKALPGSNLFPKSSPASAWIAAFRSGVKQFLTRIRKTGLLALGHCDMMVLPRALVEHPLYGPELLDAKGRIDFYGRPLVKWVLAQQISEVFGLFPEISGLVVRIGETYLYDSPFHTGHSPLAGREEASREEQQILLAHFISFLRDQVCVRHGRILIFRTWETFDHRAATAEYYINVTDRIPQHELLYFSAKHTRGDFLRDSQGLFNAQLGQGKHAQIIEVSCQRAYEGKGAFPNYIGDGVINGFAELQDRKGLKHVINASQIRGLWTWSRGDGWWGPYLKGNELWVDLHVQVLSSWWRLRGGMSEEDVFHAVVCPRLLPPLAGQGCKRLRALGLAAANATLRTHYCPEVNGCGGWIRDDRLGGLDVVGWVLQSHTSDIARWEGTMAIKGEDRKSVV